VSEDEEGRIDIINTIIHSRRTAFMALHLGQIKINTRIPQN
jgi:hypothetical protein